VFQELYTLLGSAHSFRLCGLRTGHAFYLIEIIYRYAGSGHARCDQDVRRASK